MQVTVKFKKLNPLAEIPRYMSDGAAGMDVEACLSLEDKISLSDDGTERGKRYISLKPNIVRAIPTGLAVEIPQGYEIQVRPRSGLALNHGVTVLNTPGTIDSDYRGEIKVILINLSNKYFRIQNGDRIAQLVVAPVAHASIEEVDELSQTDRGSGGFGHTG